MDRPERVRHFTKVSDLSVEEIRKILKRAFKLKERPHADRSLTGRTVALIFSKPSTRTRVSFSVCVYQLGGMALYLSEQELQMRSSESLEDTARVLSRFVDAIVIRTFAQSDVDELAAHATVPVINALTDERHPCQALSDIFTFEERFPDSKGRTITYMGDGNNVAVSLAAAGALSGIDVCLGIPEEYDLAPALWEEIQGLAAAHGTRVWVERDPERAVETASAVYTDVWTSMGQERDQGKLQALQPYQVNRGLMSVAPWEAIVMHCLPAHRGEEITDEIMDGPQSVVFDQAENRVHVQKALLTFLLGGD
ncbi:MAG: ornithine carbamoyltransferase [Actinobacteria bacterium]|nr:ornithine carbamoyltransferase [Actinomycetota bacterium]